MKSILLYFQKRKHYDVYGSKEHVKKHVIEIFIYLIFLIFASIVCLATRDTMMFYFNSDVHKLFVERMLTTEFEEEITFDEIVTITDWWEWMEQTFMNGLYGHYEEEEGEKDETADNSTSQIIQNKLTDFNVLLGPPRIRQKRVKSGSCSIHKVFQNYFRKCFGPFTEFNEDTKEIPLGSEYLSGSEMKSYRTWGGIRSYSGGGFVELLTLERDSTEDILNRLKQGEWIDRGTRLLIVEFSLYNTNVDYFLMAQFISEVVPSGGFHTSHSIKTFKLFPVWNFEHVLVILSMIMYLLLIVYYTIEEFLELRHLGLTVYLKFLWNWVDNTLIILGYVSLIFNIVNPIVLHQFLEEFKNNPKKFNSIERISFWNQVYLELMAINIFFIWVKVFKYIGFNKTMKQFSQTISGCAKDLFGFLVMFIIVFLAYAQMGLLLFGTQNEQFRDLSESFVTMVRMVLGDFQYEEMEKANRLLGPVFFISYILLVFFILLNMFLAIINDKYAEVKGEVKSGALHLEGYLIHLGRKLWNLCTCKKNKNKELDDKKVEDAKVEDAKVEDAKVEDEKMEDKKLDDEPPSPDIGSPISDEEASKVEVDPNKVMNKYFETINENDQAIEELNKRVKNMEDLLVELANQMKYIIEKIEKSKLKNG